MITVTALKRVSLEIPASAQTVSRSISAAAGSTFDVSELEYLAAQVALEALAASGAVSYTAPEGEAGIEAEQVALGDLAPSAYKEDTFSATFDQAVGAKTVVVRKHGKLVTLNIPTGSTADGGGAAIQSGATELPAAYRPAANLSFVVAITSNNVKAAGKLIVSAAGRLSFYATVAEGTFTDNAVAGFDGCSVTFPVA